MTHLKGIHNPIDSNWLGVRVSIEVNIQISRLVYGLDLMATKYNIILVHIPVSPPALPKSASVLTNVCSACKKRIKPLS